MNFLRSWLFLSFLSMHFLSVHANPLPGEGVTIQPVQTSIEERFQTLIVTRALEELGYDVKPIVEMSYDEAYSALASGGATFMAASWAPLHKDKYEKAGGDDAIYRAGLFIPGAAQGYVIDKKTAVQHGIYRLDQLEDPLIAELFDHDGDGMADLIGCDLGWGCAGVIEHQLQAYSLQRTVTHVQGDYSVLISKVVDSYRKQKPVLYYAWTPHWVSGELVPGKDVIWLEVPFSALPGLREAQDTTLPNGKNYGFEMNSQRIAANLAFAREHAAAAKLFEVMQLDIQDISAQNMIMHRGYSQNEDIDRHVKGWIRANQALFEHWLDRAREASH
ncbi:glycine betaine/L-proline ABC transporter substrate-binding protein ProX [Thaumasiovibrio sp. DFM-14]|uniref:glycine betaine/L-proline ABC transporter substrate-binding protein ProX n=1 Tax=Thaumasiovibrio sp. DFM-14 TaxID=3384792 RepID=UPI00399F42AC